MAPKRNENRLLNRKYLLAQMIRDFFKSAPDVDMAVFWGDDLKSHELLADIGEMVRALDSIAGDLKPDFQYYKNDYRGESHECIGITVDDRERLEDYLKNLKRELQVPFKMSGTPDIRYNAVSGVGSVNKAIFKFKNHQPEYRLFERLYEHINKSIKRYDVLVLIGYYEAGEKRLPRNKSNETYAINKTAKSLRKRTGLDTSQIVNNNGDLTLVGNKVESSHLS